MYRIASHMDRYLSLCLLVFITWIPCGSSSSSTDRNDYFLNFSAPKYTPLSVNYTTTVDPGVSWGLWQGWGVSLCWWAHVLGKSEFLADAVFTMKFVSFKGRQLPGLGLNIIRFNLGGSGWNKIGDETMSASPNIPSFKQIPGFWLDWLSDDPSSSSWNWSVAPKRIDMLRMAKERGVDHFELFSNSPMWWMLENHNPSGSTAGLTNNLQPWNFQNFTKYLAITVQHFKKALGVEFTSVEPFNEPASLYWNARGTQEGCHFDRSLQEWTLNILAKELQHRGLSTTIAASDEWHYDMAVETWNAFNKSTQALVGKVNTHGYQYANGRRDLLYEATRGKALWNSEYADGSGSGLEMATNLNLDFHWLHPIAWCYWQIVDESDGWGFFQANLHDEDPDLAKVNTKFFVMAQYSRHIRPGMQIIDGGEANTVAAYDTADRRLVLVTANYGNAQWVTYNLSKFTSIGGPATRWCTNTDGGETYAKHHDLQAGKVMSVYFAKNTVQTIEIDHVYFSDHIFV